MFRKKRNKVENMAEMIKESRNKYLSDMDSYIIKIKTMSDDTRKLYAQDRLKKSGIMTPKGNLSPKYK